MTLRRQNRRFFGRLRESLTKSLHRLCCLSNGSGNEGVNPTGLTTDDARVFHRASRQGRSDIISNCISVWSLVSDLSTDIDRTFDNHVDRGSEISVLIVPDLPLIHDNASRVDDEKSLSDSTDALYGLSDISEEDNVNDGDVDEDDDSFTTVSSFGDFPPSFDDVEDDVVYHGHSYSTGSTVSSYSLFLDSEQDKDAFTPVSGLIDFWPPLDDGEDDFGYDGDSFSSDSAVSSYSSSLDTSNEDEDMFITVSSLTSLSTSFDDDDSDVGYDNDSFSTVSSRWSFSLFRDISDVEKNIDDGFTNVIDSFKVTADLTDDESSVYPPSDTDDIVFDSDDDYGYLTSSTDMDKFVSNSWSSSVVDVMLGHLINEALSKLHLSQ